MNHEFYIREINPQSEQEVTQVATRMRQTLSEVLGEERGQAMYTMAWLKNRVLWHLDAEKVVGRVFLAESSEGAVVGHVIVRLDQDNDGHEIGLFSTTYVEPTFRRSGVATLLLQEGERWMLEQGMTKAVTYTDEQNIKLQNLYNNHGYAMTKMPKQFVQLAKSLEKRERISAN